MKVNKTAILVFANSAEKELNSKSIQSTDFFDLLNTETLKTVKKTGLPYFHFSENEQIGETFGARFTNAIQAVYDKGYDTVISVGNDTPHLAPRHILKAQHELQSSDYVLGPSTDGGFYLMGFKKTHFNKTHLKALPWQTNTLQFVLRKVLKANAYTIVNLETLSDIDVAADIELVLRSSKTLASAIKKALIKIREIDNTTFSIVKFFTNHIYLKLQQNKGSPILLPI